MAVALLLLLVAAPCGFAVPLRAPGASTNDGYIFIGGLGSACANPASVYPAQLVSATNSGSRVAFP